MDVLGELSKLTMWGDIAYEQYKQYQFHLQLREYQLTGNREVTLTLPRE